MNIQNKMVLKVSTYFGLYRSKIFKILRIISCLILGTMFFTGSISQYPEVYLLLFIIHILLYRELYNREHKFPWLAHRFLVIRGLGIVVYWFLIIFPLFTQTLHSTTKNLIDLITLNPIPTINITVAWFIFFLSFIHLGPLSKHLNEFWNEVERNEYEKLKKELGVSNEELNRVSHPEKLKRLKELHKRISE